MVASNQPFTEVDNMQFRALMSFMRPPLKTKMVHATQIREKIDLSFADARERFKKLVKGGKVYYQSPELPLILYE